MPPFKEIFIANLAKGGCSLSYPLLILIIHTPFKLDKEFLKKNSQEKVGEILNLVAKLIWSK
jgi:hypothetical protein